LCESNPQSASATLGGVTALKFWSLHCGVQRTCRVVVPTGMSIASTCAGELSWSVDPGFNCGALAVRADGRSRNLAPLGPARICTCIFLSSIVRVAVEPEESMLIVPLVWTRHCAAAVTVNSSCKRICLRALRKRMPRLTALEEKKRFRTVHTTRSRILTVRRKQCSSRRPCKRSSRLGRRKRLSYPAAHYSIRP